MAAVRPQAQNRSHYIYRIISCRGSVCRTSATTIWGRRFELHLRQDFFTFVPTSAYYPISASVEMATPIPPNLTFAWLSAHLKAFTWIQLESFCAIYSLSIGEWTQYLKIDWWAKPEVTVRREQCMAWPADRPVDALSRPVKSGTLYQTGKCDDHS